MEYIIKDRGPAALFRFFEEISAIPRGSYNEAAIAAYIEAFASERGLGCIRDAHNNVFVRRPASPGYESRPAVMLQGHTDMVCEKNGGAVHDFKKDGLKLYTDNGWLKAEGTTLGADDGSAVALMLTLLDDMSYTGPELECLFTAEEEVGLGGAQKFDYSPVKARYIINLDSEDEGGAWVSCAGSVYTDIKLPAEYVPFRNKAIKISLLGLAGGHSGIDIDKNRANAVRLLGKILARLYGSEPFNLISIEGGDKLNAIPRECSAVISVLDEASARVFLDETAKKIKAELSRDDSSFKLYIGKAPASERMATYKTTSALLSALALAPEGVIAMSPDIKGLVKTSSNLGSVKTEGDYIVLSFMSRSSSEFETDGVCLAFERLAKVVGAECVHGGRHPGWAYKRGSPLQSLYADTWRRLFGGEAKISAVHAGLECGVIIDRLGSADIGGADAISIGPVIKNIHTPDETMELDSYGRLWLLVCEMLKNIE